MKRFAVLTATLLLLLTSTTKVAAKTPELLPNVSSGQKCLRLGTAALSDNGESLTCVEKGEKWVSGKWVWNYVWIKVAPQVPYVPKRIVPATKPGAPFKKVDYPLIGTIAKNVVLKQNKSVHDVFVVYWDPTTTAMKRTFYTKQLEVMAKYYLPLVPTNRKIHIFILGSSKEWGTQQLTDFFSAGPYGAEPYAKKFPISTNCNAPGGVLVTDVEGPADYAGMRGGGGGISVEKGWAMVAFSNCDVNIELDLLYHETFHSVQFANSYISATFNRGNSWGTIPTWYTEGQAQYFGQLLAEDFGWKSFAFKKTAGRYWGQISDRWKTEYKYLEPYGANDAYYIGAIMYEYLLAKFGLEKTMSLYDATHKLGEIGFNESTRYVPFDTVFHSTFGQTRENFWEEVKQYIKWLAQQEPNK